MQKRIRIVVILGIISLIGLIITQIYWINGAFNISEKKLDQSITVALINVAHEMAGFSEIESPNPNPVVQLSADYFVVNINAEIDANILEHYLILEFNKNNIALDFEYGIYDCESDQMLYGNYLNPKEHKEKQIPGIELPLYDQYIYYFGVRFPGKTHFIVGDYKNWLFSSLILIIVILFFGVTLFIILKQKKLSEIQTDFINNMTHEFKTPISTIKVSSEVLSQTAILEQPERHQKYVQIIKSENERLQQQVETVLQMADIEKKFRNMKKEALDIHLLLNDVGSQQKLRLNQNESQITYDLKAKNHVAMGDQLHIKNLLSNLLENAVKYSLDEIAITLKTYNKNDSLYIEIVDKGIGIAKDQQKRIFDKFYRIPKGDVHDVKGFGLGLNYVANVIKNHGWKIEVESQLKQGSTFRIKITL